MATLLCHADDISEGCARGFDNLRMGLFAVKQKGKVYLYINSCPHLGIPLNFEPDKFLDPDGAYIMCSGHGALFDISTGDCLLGPCRGAHLLCVEFVEKEGQIFIEEEKLQGFFGTD